MRIASMFLVAFTLGCGAEGNPDTHKATKLDPKVEIEAPKPTVKGPDAGAPALSAPPDADAPSGIIDAKGSGVEVVWEGDYRIQSMAVDETHIYISRGAVPGGDRGEIARIALAGGKPEVIIGDLGRPDEITVSGDEVFWIDRPGREGDPPTGIRAAPKIGGEARTVATDPRVEHGLTVAGDHVFWVLRVEEQGKVGGFAGAPRTGGQPQDLFREKGPVFHLAAGGDRLYFMAHVGSQPDVLYTCNTDGSDLRELHAAERGIVALHPGDTHLYWAQARFDQLETSIMRVPVSGGAAQTLWRLEGKLLDQLTVVGDRVWTSTSAVEDLGEVFWIPQAGGDGTKVAESRHVWQLFGVGEHAYWWDTYYEGDKKMHRVRTPK